jgi:cysteinyl-tRNA synthetase
MPVLPLVASMGTTGTLMGLSRRFRELDPSVRIIGVEPYMGHKIQGLKNMKESYRPGIFEKSRADRIVNIDDEEAFETTRRLAREEGIFAGMSSGAAVAAALKMAAEMDEGRIVVILPDGGERYLSTSLFVDRKKSGLMVYNTLTRTKEAFVPLEENRVSIYACGPTMCEHIRIGHCRRIVFVDLLHRYLALRRYDVRLIMNVTDLDERTIQGALDAGVPLREFTDRYYQAFMEDLETLNIRRATEYPRASEHVDDMIRLAEQLVEKGFAYEKFRSIYFDISRFRGYGALSRIDLDKIRVGKTVDLEQYEKANPRDFTLLRRTTLRELKEGLFYETRWGNIQPSWHLECPAMALKYLGPTYDIHASGIELLFPHHENTIAISQAATGKPPARYWLHNEQVLNEGKDRDPEEADNTLTVREIMAHGYTGRDIRFWLISHHYRRPITFSWKKLEIARKSLVKLDTFVEKLLGVRTGPAFPEIDQVVYDLRHSSFEALDDDLNVARALAALFRFIRRINRIMDRSGLSSEDRDKVLKALESANSVLGVLDLKPGKPDETALTLIKERESARKARDWETADRIRDQLRAMGVEVIDTKDGPVVRR